MCGASKEQPYSSGETHLVSHDKHPRLPFPIMSLFGDLMCPLSAQVMRLTRPSLIRNNSIDCEASDVALAASTVVALLLFAMHFRGKTLPPCEHMSSCVVACVQTGHLSSDGVFLAYASMQGQESDNCVSVSGTASLPQSFGSIFLGETFTSYVIAHNGSKEAVQNVQVKVCVQYDMQNLHGVARY